MDSAVRLVLRAVMVCGVGCGVAQAEITAKDVSRAANVGISVMLLGNVAFMMGLFYLVNHKDQELRMNSWKVISATISIFSAVLLFQGVNGVVEEGLLEDATESFELFVSVVLFMCFLGILQFALAFICGAIGKPPKTEREMYKMTLQAKCWGTLMGHITGFAAINAFGVLQQQVPRKAGPLFLVAPLAWMVIRLIVAYTGRFREIVALGDDKVDEAEEKWIEETEETEDDVIGLAVSFMVAQAMRFVISGVMPDPEGNEPKSAMSSHSDLEVAMLVGSGLVLAFLEVLRNMYIKSRTGRFSKQLRNVVAMIMAWFFFFATDWWLCGHFFRYEQGMMKEVVRALLITSTSLSMIFGLIKVAELDITENAMDHAIRKMVQALGILIGFSWEKAFDVAVASITEEVTFLPGPMTKLLLAFFIGILVIPAWRKYILPTILEYDEIEEEEEQREEGVEAKREAMGAGDGKVSPLSEPLLDRSPGSQVISPGSSPGKAKKLSIGAMDSVTLKKKYKECKGHVATLEARNSTLENSLGDIISELWELRRIADVLRSEEKVEEAGSKRMHEPGKRSIV